MKLLKQFNDYSCGLFAIYFLLNINGCKVFYDDLLDYLQPSSEEGTSHVNIEKLISFVGKKFISQDNSNLKTLKENLPAIINYQYCDNEEWDGHYSVIIGIVKKSFIIYNPATGEIELLSFEELEKTWFSERYGKGWFLKII